MAIQFACSKCGCTLEVGDRFAGAKIRCPKCLTISAAPAAEKRPDPSPKPSEPAKAAQPKRTVVETFDEIEPVDFHDHDREEEELDMTPMVDVTFLLLIFFMITAAFSMQKSLEIPKPSEDNTVSPSTVVEPEEGNIKIRIDRDNAIWVNDSEAHSEQDLLIKLREARAGVPGSESPPINSTLVMADEDSLHETVVMALDACNAVGMEQIRLAQVNEDDF